ncbi:DUF4394 domain-containing protein [Rubellimicrobium roseum]|uniref:VPLPA-CTERM sorting domain-containing protein n=1 Tax=Rubellimicrobium roseum TaxID=687525 RepID=A0A5C4N4W9_9RHOB|nr:DUF4394 domain-containing protein [Rubellimicrobium roseum]TNC63555.1 VPLPA-CTERM sorting domain-containing protein [Rubellimicrobium roseum]
MRSRRIAAAALATTLMAGAAGAATTGLGYALGDGGATLVTIGHLGDPQGLAGVALSTADGMDLALSDLSVRPNTGGLYGYSGATNSYYLVDPATGVATPQAMGPGINEGAAAGFDFNNVIDAARLVTTNDDNFVFDPKAMPATVTQATDLFYVAGDVNEGRNPGVFANAYTNAVPMASANVQYVLDSATNSLAILGNNAGTLSTVSQLTLNGRAVDISSVGGFDILSMMEGDNTAYALLSIGGVQSLYSFLLPQAGGMASLNFLGEVGTAFGSMNGLAVANAPAPIPLPAGVFLLGGALAGLGFLRRRAVRA